MVDDDAQITPTPPTPATCWRAAFTSALQHVRQDRVSVAAGSFAYRWFLSIFPMIIALLGISAVLDVPHQTTAKLIQGVTKALPSGAASVFTTALRNTAGTHSHSSSIAAIVVAGAVGLWSATSGMVMVEEGLDMAYEIQQDRTFLAKRLRALPLLAAAVLLGGSASALIVFGHSIGNGLQHSLPFAGQAFQDGWTALRWVAALALIALLFSVLYYAAPNQPEPRWRWFSPGTLVGTTLWALSSVGFSVYTSESSSYTSTYGAFAGVAILIFWLYLTGIAILAGGEINAAFERQSPPTRSGQDAAKPPRSGVPSHCD